MTKIRTIRLKDAFCEVEGSTLKVQAFTESGAHYVLRFSLDDSEAACAIRSLSRLVAESVKRERAHHVFLREEARVAWAAINSEIEEKKAP